MRLALTVLLIVPLTGAASAQHTVDARGFHYSCLPGDRSCSVLPPPGDPLQPLPDNPLQNRKHIPPPPFLGARPPVPYVPPPTTDGARWK